VRNIHAHVLTAVAPEVPIDLLRPYVSRTTVGAHKSWKLNPITLVGAEDPHTVVDTFNSWRRQWHTEYDLGLRANVRYAALRWEEVSPVWSIVATKDHLPPMLCELLLEQVPKVSDDLHHSELDCVALLEEGIVNSYWHPGFEATYSNPDSPVEIHIDPDGAHLTCTKCGSDRLYGWDLRASGSVFVQGECGEGGELAADADLVASLIQIGPGLVQAQVKLVPWDLCMSQTVKKVRAACQKALQFGVGVDFTRTGSVDTLVDH